MIGFETNPKPCDMIFFYRWQLRRVDDTVISMENVPPGVLDSFQTTPDGENYYNWEQWSDYADDDNWHYMRAALVAHPDTNASTLARAAWIKIDVDPDEIMEFIRDDLLDKGLLEHMGGSRVFAFNVHDERFYVFENVDPEIDREGDKKKRQLYFEAMWINGDPAPVNMHFNSLNAFAPTQSKMSGGIDYKYNDRWYAGSSYASSHGRPSQDPAEMGMLPGIWTGSVVAGLYPDEEYLVYMPWQTQTLYKYDGYSWEFSLSGTTAYLKTARYHEIAGTEWRAIVNGQSTPYDAYVLDGASKSVTVTVDGNTVWSGSADSENDLEPPSYLEMDFNGIGDTALQEKTIEITFSDPVPQRKYVFEKLDGGSWQWTEEILPISQARPSPYRSPRETDSRNAKKGADFFGLTRFQPWGGLIRFGTTWYP